MPVDNDLTPFPSRATTPAWEVIMAICRMDFTRMARQKAMVVGMWIMPAILLVIVGNGAGAMSGLGARYVQFILPGIIGLSVSFTATLAAARFFLDRKHGFLRVSFLAPVSRTVLFVAKISSATLLSVAQGAIFLLFLPFLHVPMEAGAMTILLLAIGMIAASLNAIGLALASVCESYENLQALSIGIKFPLVQITPAFFPLSSLKGVLGTVVAYNPLTYGLDAMKHMVLTPLARSRLHIDFPVSVDLISMAAFTMVCVAIAWHVFRYRD